MKAIARQLGIAAFAASLLIVAASAARASDQVRKVFDRPHTSSYGPEKVPSMAEFGGDLYICAGRDNPPELRIYRLDHAGCKLWDDVSPRWRTPPSSYACEVVVFGGHLYVGTSEGEIYRTADGNKWIEVTGNLTGHSTRVYTMGVFQNRIYVVTNGSEIWRSANGTSWEVMVGPPPALHTYGFGSSGRHDIQAMSVLGGYLYAGVGKDDSNGIEIWRSSNGKNWSLFRSQSGPGHVQAMEAFKGYLYIGRYHGNSVYRTNGVPGNWQEIPVTQMGDVMALRAHGGKLYLGALIYEADLNGNPLLYETSDGSTWAPVSAAPLGKANQKGIMSMESAGTSLFYGTYDTASGAQVFELGSALMQCAIRDLQNSSQKTLRDWLWGLKTVLEDGKVEVKRNKKNASASLLEDFAGALAGAEVAGEDLGLKEWAQTCVEYARGEIESVIFLEGEACASDDPAVRFELLTTAIGYLEAALDWMEEVAGVLAAIDDAPEPLVFADGFEYGTDAWDLAGGAVGYEFLGEPALLGASGAAALARCQALEDRATLSFRVMPIAGRALASLGNVNEVPYFAGIEFGKVTLFQFIDGMLEPIEIAEIAMDPFEWQAIRIERTGGDLVIGVNGFETVAFPVGGGPGSLQPFLIADPDAVVLFDDVELARLR